MTECPGCMGSGRVAERDRWFTAPTGRLRLVQAVRGLRAHRDRGCGMTPEEIADLRKAANAATPGQWSWNGYSLIAAPQPDDDPPEYPKGPRPGPPWSYQEGGEADAVWLALREAAYNADPCVASVPAHYGDTATGRHAADARYIELASPANILALLDALAERDETQPTRGKLKTENARLRAALQLIIETYEDCGMSRETTDAIKATRALTQENSA